MYYETPFLPPSSRFTRLGESWPQPARPARPESAYREIVVPLDRDGHDFSAVSLALAMATPGETKITVLSVSSPAAPRVQHGLDAIGKLHTAVPAPAGDGAPQSRQSEETLRAGIERAVRRFAADSHCWAFDVNVEHREGAFVEEVVRYCHRGPVDLLVLSHRRSRWRLPITPAKIRKVLRAAKVPVVVVHPPTAQSNSAPPATVE